MSWTNWRRPQGLGSNLAKRVSRTPFTKRRACPRLSVEQLEGRVVPSATLWTNRSDYQFGDVAVIGGSGFQPLEAVQLQVLHAAGTAGSNSDAQNQPWQVTADANGNLTATWDVTDPDAVGASYELTATGQASGVTAQAAFTDGFGLSKLTVGGSEDYLFTAGDKIVPTGNVDNGKYYDIVVTDPNGVRRNSFARTATSNFSTADNSYTIQASDPITTSKAYTFTLREFADATTT